MGRNDPVCPDREIFRRTPRAWWAIRSETYKHLGVETYASHLGCPVYGTSSRSRNKWSWFIDDDHAVCYGCGVRVPDYIQALILLHMWE